MYHCVYGDCNSDSRAGRPGFDSTVKFYPFPQPCLQLRKAVLVWSQEEENEHVSQCKKCRLCSTWIKNCGRADERFNRVRYIRHNFRICSKHFKETPAKMDFEKFIPVSTLPKTPSSVYRRWNRSEERVMITSTDASTSAGELGPLPQERNVKEELPANIVVGEVKDEFLAVQDAATINQQNSVMIDGSVQVVPSCSAKSCQTVWTFADRAALLHELHEKNSRIKQLEKENDELKRMLASSAITTFEKKILEDGDICQYYTGLAPNDLSVLIEFSGDVEEKIFLAEEQALQQSSQSSCSKGNRKLTWTQELLLMMARIRGGLLLEDMAYRFDLSEASISRITTKWITALYEKFISMKADMFSSREMIQKHTPDRFRRFKNLRIIIDCAEIRCERPSNFEQQGNCYSSYKAHTTYKFLLGCAPNGSVTFISPLFEGSISDREIVMKSGLVEMLEEGDLVLADRGFTISDLTDGKGVTLKIPAFLMGRDKLTPQEEIATKEIAANRIFVEHVVGRLKNFRFLQRVVPQSMRYLLTQVVYVCGCLLNFQPPLVK